MEESAVMNIVDFYADPDDRRRLMDMLFESNGVCDFETKLKHKKRYIFDGADQLRLY